MDEKTRYTVEVVVGEKKKTIPLEIDKVWWEPVRGSADRLVVQFKPINGDTFFVKVSND